LLRIVQHFSLPTEALVNSVDEIENLWVFFRLDSVNIFPLKNPMKTEAEKMAPFFQRLFEDSMAAHKF